MSDRPIHIQITDLNTGVVIEDTYRLNGRLHRPFREGPAVTYRSAEEGGAVTEEWYYWDGRVHRLDGPAKILNHHIGPKLRHEVYYRHGRIHRDPHEGPAWIEYDEDGNVHSQGYFANGYPRKKPDPHNKPERPSPKVSKKPGKAPSR
jgi:uncharacterized protein